MNGKYIRRSITTVIFLAVYSAILSASTVIPMNLQDLSAKANQIVTGRIERMTSSRDAATGHLITRVELADTRSFAGDALGTLAVNMLGGTSGDIRESIAGFPAFNTGDRVVLFLADETATPFGPTVGLWQGVFFVEQDTAGVDIVTDHLRRPITEIRGNQVVAGTLRLPRGAVAQTAGPRVSLDTFLSRVRDLRGAANASDRK